MDLFSMLNDNVPNSLNTSKSIPAKRDLSSTIQQQTQVEIRQTKEVIKKKKIKGATLCLFIF